MSNLKELVKLGKEIGLEGEDLREFINKVNEREREEKKIERQEKEIETGKGKRETGKGEGMAMGNWERKERERWKGIRKGISKAAVRSREIKVTGAK